MNQVFQVIESGIRDQQQLYTQRMDRSVSEKKEEKNTDKVEPPKPEDVPTSLCQPLLLCQSPPMSSGTSNTIRVEQELSSCALECSSGAAASATSSSVSTHTHFVKDTSKSPFLVANTSDDKVEDSDKGNCTKRVETLARDNDVTNWRMKRVYHRAPKERITAGMELSLQESEPQKQKIQEENASNSDSNPPPQVDEVRQVSQEDQDLIDFEGILSRLITYTAPGSRVPSERRFYVYTELVTEKKAQYYSEKLTTLNRRFKNEVWSQEISLSEIEIVISERSVPEKSSRASQEVLRGNSKAAQRPEK